MLVVDEIGIKNNVDKFQDLLMALCFNHQIVNQAVSLPEPLFQAHELAKRGRNNYLTMRFV